jgi:hypothetical protein
MKTSFLLNKMSTPNYGWAVFLGFALCALAVDAQSAPASAEQVAPPKPGMSDDLQNDIRASDAVFSGQVNQMEPKQTGVGVEDWRLQLAVRKTYLGTVDKTVDLFVSAQVVGEHSLVGKTCIFFVNRAVGPHAGVWKVLPATDNNSALVAAAAAKEMSFRAAVDDQLAFTALVVPNQIVVNGPGTRVSILMELRVDNLSKSRSTRAAVLIDKFETPTLVITGDQGVVASSDMQDSTFEPENSDFHVVWPGETTYIPIECSLGVRPNGLVYMGYKSRFGAYWTIGPMLKGTYQLVLQYQVKNKASHALKMEDPYPTFALWTLAPWEGSISTAPVTFTIK